MKEKSLDGVRIIACEDFLAMPFATMLLADLGAEVIRVLSHNRLNLLALRPFPDNKPGPRYWDHNGSYDNWYRNKKSLTLDLKKSKAQDIFRDLVKISDIVMENMRPGVMKRFGLDYDGLKKIKNDIIMVSSCGYGHEGIWGSYGAFARTIDAMSGMSHLSGYIGGPPERINPSYMDTTTAWNNAIAAMMALHYRRRTGKGQWIDHSMYESGVSCIGEAILDFQVNGRLGSRIGNRHRVWAPHGCYPCTGNDEWVVISVTSDKEWRALCNIMEMSDLIEDERFSDALNRWKNQEQLDPIIQKWSKYQNRHEIAHKLQAGGVPAAPVNRSKDLFQNPHLKERGFFQWYRRPDAKEMDDVLARPYIGWPFKMTRTQPTIEFIANMGEHNEYVLGELLGRSKQEILQLYEEGIIGNEPIGAEEKRPKPKKRTMTDKRMGSASIIEIDPDYKEVLGFKY